MQAGRRARAVVAGRRGRRQRVLLRLVVTALKFRWYVSLGQRHLCHYALSMRSNTAGMCLSVRDTPVAMP